MNYMKTSLVVLALLLGLFAACGGDADTPPAPQGAAEQGGANGSPEASDEPEESTPEDAGNSSKVTAMVIDTAFEPADLTVKVGTEVTWKQVGDQPHSVTSVEGTFDSSPQCSPLKSENCDFEGDSYSFTFDEAGTFEYYCRIHGLPTGRGMFATLTVEE
ncbi:MAG: cupredoxin domain-containing protein [Actinomycetota bacterium]